MLSVISEYSEHYVEKKRLIVIVIGLLIISLSLVKRLSLSRQTTLVWRENVLERIPQASLFPCLCSLPLHGFGEAVQNKHRSSAPENIRLGITAKARHTSLLDRKKQACFMLTWPGHCVPGAALAGWTTPAGGASVYNLITCVVCSLF